MLHRFADLGSLADLYDLARSSSPLFPDDADTPAVIDRLRTELGVFPRSNEFAVQVTRTWTNAGNDGTELRWETGFGPPSYGWLLRPAGAKQPLPGVVALHCHGGIKFYGKEKIADGPAAPDLRVKAVRAELYDGAAYANELATRGFTVLVPDAFGWGSRRVPIADMSTKVKRIGDLESAARQAAGGILDEAEHYDCFSGPHEDAMAKLLGLLGTSWAGIVAREDLIAIDILASLPDVLPGGVGVVGLSGGGARAALATALSDKVGAAAIIAMMSSLKHLLDGHVHQHTWMWLSPGLSRIADWPDIAAVRRPRPLFVGYAQNDQLFSAEGMRAADARIRSLYARAGSPDAYQGTFFRAGHSFPHMLQHRVWNFFDEVLPRRSR